MENQILKWLQNWHFKSFNKKILQHKFFLRNIDNPGWLLTFQLNNLIYEKRSLNKFKIDNSKNDWCRCLIKDGEFIDVGGPFNLNEILNCFKNFVEDKKEIYSSSIVENDLINWMEKWYYAQCDEDWEHSERFIR